jgi:FAD synthase
MVSCHFDFGFGRRRLNDTSTLSEHGGQTGFRDSEITAPGFSENSERPCLFFRIPGRLEVEEYGK